MLVFKKKIGQNSIFLAHEAHILDQLYIIVPYISFYGFKKKSNLAQNPNLLAFGFTEQCRFVVKTDRNSIFLSRDPHITDRLYIIVMYISFYGFKKIKFWIKIQRC
jgi:hypothetical protein